MGEECNAVQFIFQSTSFKTLGPARSDVCVHLIGVIHSQTGGNLPAIMVIDSSAEADSFHSDSNAKPPSYQPGYLVLSGPDAARDGAATLGVLCVVVRALRQRTFDTIACPHLL